MNFIKLVCLSLLELTFFFLNSPCFQWSCVPWSCDSFVWDSAFDKATIYLCLFLIIDTWVVSMVIWVFFVLSYMTCPGSDYMAKAIRLLGWNNKITISKLLAAIFTRKYNAHLIPGLKDIVPVLSSVAEVPALPSW